MIIVRVAALPWALLQVIGYYRPYPPGFIWIGFGLAAFLGVAVVAIWLVYRRTGPEQARPLAYASLAVDVAVIMGFVWLYSFDEDTAIWALLFILPLEGAIRFQLRGALLVWAAVAVLYSIREVWASAEYGFPLLWNSITFRMGIGLIIAAVAGSMARDLVRRRDVLHDALARLSRTDELRSALVSTLAHDVRNPLTTIRGVHQTLLTYGDRIEPHERLGLLETADRQSERLQRLSTDLLDLARLEQGRMEVTPRSLPLKPIVEEAVGYLEGGAQVEIAIDPNEKVLADPSRLQQVVVNLTSNALEHAAPPFKIAATSRNGHVDLSFVDHGPGIDPEDVDELFDPFRGRSEDGSIGFGLAIVKAMVEAQDGDVEYRPNSPRGSRFIVRLPVPDGSETD